MAKNNHHLTLDQLKAQAAESAYRTKKEHDPAKAMKAGTQLPSEKGVENMSRSRIDDDGNFVIRTLNTSTEPISGGKEGKEDKFAIMGVETWYNVSPEGKVTKGESSEIRLKKGDDPEKWLKDISGRAPEHCSLESMHGASEADVEAEKVIQKMKDEGELKEAEYKAMHTPKLHKSTETKLHLLNHITGLKGIDRHAIKNLTEEELEDYPAHIDYGNRSLINDNNRERRDYISKMLKKHGQKPNEGVISALTSGPEHMGESHGHEEDQEGDEDA